MAHRSHAPNPSKAQSKLIDDLGGPKEVADYVSAYVGRRKNPLRTQSISQWRKRGIPFAYRACLAIRAREKGIGVPPGFLNEQARG